MGIFCMVFGVVIFLGFTGGGFLLANALISAPSTNAEASFYAGGSLTTFLGLPTTPAPYIVVCAFIGLLIGLSLFMQGLTYQKVCKVARRRREH